MPFSFWSGGKMKTRSISTLVALAAIVFLAGACKSTFGTGAYLAPQGFKGAKQLSETKVQGRACKQQIFFVPVGDYSLNAAMSDALSHAPEGTTGLMNVKVSTSVPLFGGALFGRYCFEVEGFPAKRENVASR
jgi:hypothetical protein